MNPWQSHHHLLTATGEELKHQLRLQHAPPKLLQSLDDLLDDWGDLRAVRHSLELLQQEAEKWHKPGSLSLRAFIQTTHAWISDIQQNTGGMHV